MEGLSRQVTAGVPDPRGVGNGPIGRPAGKAAVLLAGLAPEAARSWARRLERAGHPSAEAPGDARAAVDRIAATGADVVLAATDGEDAGRFDLARALRNAAPAALVLCVAEADEAALTVGEEIGCDGFLAEAMSPAEVTAVLDRAVRKARFARRLRAANARGEEPASATGPRADTLLASLGAHLPDAALYRLEFRPDGAIACTYASPGFDALLGLRADELTGDPLGALSRILTPEEAVRLTRHLAEIAGAAETCDFETQVTHGATGAPRWVRFRSILVERRTDGTRIRDGLAVDTTETRTREERLRGSGQRLATLFLGSPNAAFLVDAADGTILDANEPFARLAGRARPELIGRRSGELGRAHGVDPEAGGWSLAAGADEGRVVPGSLFRPDGRVLEVEISAARIELDRRACLVVSVADLTERREVERERKEQTALLSSIAANLPRACFYRMLYTPAGEMRALFVSPNVELLFGYSAAEFQADPTRVFRYLHPDDRAGFLVRLGESLRTGGPGHADVRVADAHGNYRWLSFSSCLAERRADGGQVRDGVVVDITPQQRTAAELEATQSRLERALSASRTCTWENDVPRGRIRLDAAWGEMTGRPAVPTEATPRELVLLVHPDDRAEAWATARRAILGGVDDYRVDQRMRSGDGSWRWVRTLGRVTARDERGRAVTIVGTNTDITDRKEAEEQVRVINQHLEKRVAARTAELAASEALYRTLVENIDQGYYRADARALFTYCNRGIEAVLGTTGAELRGTSVFRCVAETDRKRVIASYLGWVRDGSRHGTAEFRVTVAGGKERWVEQTTLLMRAEDGAFAGSLNVLRDISERRAAEEKLRLSEERFRAVFDYSPALNALVTVAEARVVELNAAAEAAFGFGHAEAVGRTLEELGVIVSAEAAAQVRTLLGAAGSVTAAELPVRRRDGRTFFVRLSACRIQIGGQQFTHLAMQDITEEREHAERFRSVFAASPIPILLTALADGRLLEVNAAGLAMFGYGRDEVIGRTTEELGLWVEPDKRAAFHERVKAAGVVRDFEAVLTGKSGERRVMLCTGTVVRIAERECLLTSAVDLTAVRAAEAEHARLQHRLYQNQKFEALGTLAGGVAHDFNNILSGIINFTALALADLPQSAERVAGYLTRVLAGGERARLLTRQILLFSRAEEGKQEAVLLPAVAKEALALLRSTVPATIAIETEIAADTPAVLADATQLHQVVMNLGVNAMQAIQPGAGRITVRIGAIDLGPEAGAAWPELKPGRHARLEVADTGCGIAPELQARIFEPFFTTKPVGQGTGLGLAVVRSVVQRHRGALAVRSEPGAGTTFTILLPAQPTTPAVLRSAWGDLPKGDGAHLLVVDDEEAVVDSLVPLLERLGYRVTAARAPQEALARLEAAPADFAGVLSDFQMPGMNGLDLAQRAREIRPDLPVIVASGFTGNFREDQLRAGGVVAVLEKPFVLTELAAALARHLPTSDPARKP